MGEDRVRLWLRSYDARATRHAHAGFHQVVLPVAGALRMEIGRSADAPCAGTVREGTGVLVPCGEPHRFSADGANRFVVMDLPDTALHPAGFPHDAVRRAVAAPFFAVGTGLRHLIHYLASETKDGPVDPGTAHHASGLLLDALSRSLTRPAAMPEPVARALDLLHRHYAEPIAVADLAHAAGLSVSRFHEVFRDATGRSPAAALTEIRLDRAVELLRGTDLPIAEVALAAGYSDQTALTRALRRRRGVTPAGLRRSGRS